MKIFKRVLLILVIVFFAFMLIGLIFPSFEYGNSITVNASPEKCWKVCLDTSEMHSWIPGFQSLILKNGKPFEKNALYEFTIVDGEKMVMSQKIKDISPNKIISYELNNDVLKSEYSLQFKGDGKKTIIATHYKVTGNNIFMKSILFLSKSYLKNADAEMLSLLKKVVES